MEEEKKSKLRELYDNHYKKLLIIPAILLILALIYLYSFNHTNGDIIHKAISLKGGTSITIYSETDITKLKSFLQTKFTEFDIREISDLTTGKQLAIIVETTSSAEDTKAAMEEFLGFQLNDQNSSIEFTGDTLSAGFYSQLRLAIILSFILMSIVVFILFRTFVPSFAVISCAFADIVLTLATIDLLGFHVSSAGIIALLMLIGYSVDSDILLTTRVLKRKDENIDSTIFTAFKTGLTMTLTAIAAVGISLLIVRSFSDTLTQIFSILLIGLFYDIFNTWITNVIWLKWYAEGKEHIK